MPVELPDSYDSLLKEATVWVLEGDLPRAIDNLLRVVYRLRRLRPETLERRPTLKQTLHRAWSSAVELLSWEERYDEAITLCKETADHLTPTEADRRIAALMLDQGDTEAAVACLEQLSGPSPNFDVWMDLALAYARAERYQEAVQSYQRALGLAGSNEQATLANLGLFRVYVDMGDTACALEAWDMALVLDPDLDGMASDVIRWLILSGEVDRAQRYLARETSPLRTAFLEGLIEWTAGRLDAARAKWRRVLAIESGDQDVERELWMEAALRLNEPQRAVEHIRTFLQERTDVASSVRTWLLSGVAHWLTGDLETAKRHLTYALDRTHRVLHMPDGLSAREREWLASTVNDAQVWPEIAEFLGV